MTRQLTDAEKTYGTLAIIQPNGIYISDGALRTVLDDLPDRLPGATLERTFPDGSKLLLSRNSADWAVRISKE